MTFSRFVLKNSFRNRRRTFLTISSVGFSLFLLVMLQTTLDRLLNPPETSTSILRLAVQNKISLAGQLPLAYGERLKKVPNVKLVTPLQWFGGYYQEPKNFFANFATDANLLFDVFPELNISPEEKAVFQSDKGSCIVGKDLLKRYNWTVGQQITLKGTIFPVDLDLRIAGAYDSSDYNSNMYFHFDNMNEALGKPNTVGTFWLMGASADALPAIADEVDTMFANSSSETKTQTEKAFTLGFTAMLGNVSFLIGSIASVVIFTMILVAASTMAMTIRERMREVGILKSMGFRRGMVLGMVLGEAILIAFLGALVGCAVAFAFANFIDLGKATQGFLQDFKIKSMTYGIALVAGIGIGFISGIFPAVQASRITILQALRRLD